MISPYHRRARLATAVAGCCVFVLWFWYFSHFSLRLRCDVSVPTPPAADVRDSRSGSRPSPVPMDNRSRIAKATVATNSLDSPLARRALATHHLHNRRHGYRHFIATTEFVSDVTENDPKGRPRGAWSKPAFLMSLMVAELQKDEQERLRWILSVERLVPSDPFPLLTCQSWFDADTIVMNNHIPLDIFLPPSTAAFSNVKLVISSNWDGLNSGAFAIRIDPWSVSLLSAVLAYPIYQQDRLQNDSFRDQSAFQWLLTNPGSPLARTRGLPRQHWVDAPMRWFNSFPFNNPFDKEGRWIFRQQMTDELFDKGTSDVYDDGLGAKVRPSKIMRGDMIVHMAGSSHVRESWMRPWLDRSEAQLPEWSNATKLAEFKKQAQIFWEVMELGSRDKRTDTE